MEPAEICIHVAIAGGSGKMEITKMKHKLLSCQPRDSFSKIIHATQLQNMRMMMFNIAIGEEDEAFKFVELTRNTFKYDR